MDLRSTWVRSVMGFGLLAAVVLPGCGSSEPTDSKASSSSSTLPTAASSTPTDDFSVSNWLSASLAPVDDQGTFAVVDGVAPDGLDSVKATLRIGDFIDGVLAYDLPTPPLLNPTTWVNDGTVYVQGQACDEPLLDQIGEGDPDQVCGTALGGSTLVAFDLKTGESRVVTASLPTNRFGNLIVTPSGPVALLRSFIPGTEIEEANGFEYSLLDASTGAVTPLGKGPGTEKLCPTDEGFIGTEADLVGSGGVVGDGVTEEIRLTIIDQDGSTVLPAPDPPRTLKNAFPTGCTADGDLIFPGTTDAATAVHLGLGDDGTPTWTEVTVDPLPGDGGIIAFSVPGGDLAWEPTGDTGVSFEGYIPHFLVDGTWTSRPLVPGPDSPPKAAISGPHLLALAVGGPKGSTLVRR